MSETQTPAAESAVGKPTARGPRRKSGDAKDHPVSAPKNEIHTSDLLVGQVPPIDISGNEPIIRDPDQIQPVDSPLADDYVSALAFMEEPVRILLSPTSEKFAPKMVDVYVNGIPAEILQNGKWLQIGWIPVGVPVVTKRKYVEVLARMKPTDIQTQHDDATVAVPKNEILRFTRVKHPFSVIEDRNPRGAAWLTRLIAEG